MSAEGKRLRIGLIGQFGIGNLGNEGSLEAMVRFLRAALPDADLVGICSDPDYVRRTHGIDAVAMRAPQGAGGAWRLLNAALLGMPARVANVLHTLKVCRGLDALVFPGTGVLDDYQATPLGFPYEVWRWCWGARVRGAPVAMVSIGAGPITNRLSRFFLGAAARAASFRTYRDQPSKSFMRELGLNEPDSAVFPDLAFGLPTPPSAPRSADAAPVVAIGVMSYFGWKGRAQAIYDAYIAKLVEYACWLLGTGARITLLVGSANDIQAVEDVRAGLERRCGERVGAVESRMAANLGDVMDQLSQADIAVVTRFHNLVCALHMGRPSISLGYAGKNAELQREFGLAEFCQEVETFDLDTLKTQTTAMLARRDELSRMVEARARARAARLAVQEQALLAWLRRGGTSRG